MRAAVALALTTSLRPRAPFSTSALSTVAPSAMLRPYHLLSASASRTVPTVVTYTSRPPLPTTLSAARLAAAVSRRACRAVVHLVVHLVLLALRLVLRLHLQSQPATALTTDRLAAAAMAATIRHSTLAMLLVVMAVVTVVTVIAMVAVMAVVAVVAGVAMVAVVAMIPMMMVSTPMTRVVLRLPRHRLPLLRMMLVPRSSAFLTSV